MKSDRRDGGRRPCVALAVIAAAGLGLRVGYAVGAAAPAPPDAEAYARIAANLDRRRVFDARPAGVAQRGAAEQQLLARPAALRRRRLRVSGGVHLTLARVVLAVARRARGARSPT